MLIGTIVGFVIFSVANVITPDNAFLIFGAIPIFGISNFYAGIQFSRKVDEEKKFIYPENDDDSSLEPKSENSTESLKKPPGFLYFLGIIILFSGFLLTAINFGFYRPYIQRYVLDFINDNAGLVATFYLPTALIGALIAPKLGTLADKINTYLAIAIASFLGGLVTWLIINSGNLWIFAILLVIDQTIMLTVSFVFVNFLSRVSVKHRGKIFGLITVFESIGMMIGPILGGLVYEIISPQAPFIISIIVEWSLISFFIVGIWILNPSLKRPSVKITRDSGIAHCLMSFCNGTKYPGPVDIDNLLPISIKHAQSISHLDPRLLFVAGAEEESSQFGLHGNPETRLPDRGIRHRLGLIDQLKCLGSVFMGKRRLRQFHQQINLDGSRHIAP